MHVLVCDDDAALRFVVKRWLTSTLGCVVSESCDGVEALSALDHEHIDLLLLDLELPRLSGVEVVEAIRESGSHADLPIVVLSNERRLEMIRQVVSLGVSDYLLKPLRAAVIRDRISPLLTRSRQRRRATASAIRQLGPDTSALLVEGDGNFRHVFVSAAERFGPVATAQSGADGLAAFRAAPADIVFVGTDLGIVSAESMMRKIRDVAASVPSFICVSGLDAAAARAAGFDGALERTFQPDVISRGLQPYVRHVGPLTELNECASGFEHSVDTAVPQVLGMMADLAVTGVSGPVTLPEEGMLSGQTTEVNRFSFSVVVGMSGEMAKAVASRMLCCELAEVDDECMKSTMGELSNMITGRVDTWLKERGLECRTTLPETRPITADDRAVTPGPGDGFVRGFALADVPGTAVVRVVVTVRP